MRGVGAGRTHRGVHPGLALWSSSERDTSTPRSVSGGLSMRSCARTTRRATSRSQPLEPNGPAGRWAGERRGPRGPREAAPATRACTIARRPPKTDASDGGRRATTRTIGSKLQLSCVHPDKFYSTDGSARVDVAGNTLSMGPIGALRAENGPSPCMCARESALPTCFTSFSRFSVRFFPHNPKFYSTDVFRMIDLREMIL